MNANDYRYSRPFAEFYDRFELYENRADVEFFVEEAKRSGGPVLELGCGTGRVLIPTARAGIKICGVDASSHMLNLCREKLKAEPAEVRSRVELIEGDMYDFQLEGQFNLVTTPFRPFQHLIEIEQQLACLRCVNRCLSEGGRLILDLFDPCLEMLVDESSSQEKEQGERFTMPDGREVRRCERIAHRDRVRQVQQVELIYYVTHDTEKMNASSFRIVAAQSSSVAGDIVANIRRHAELVHMAHEHGADVVVFPELSLTGYEPTVVRQSAMDSNDHALDPLQALSDELSVTMFAGCPIRSHVRKPFLGTFIIRPQKPIECYRKRFLHPGEEQHFVASNDTVVVWSHDRAIGVAICADINNPTHPADASKQQATIYAAGVAMTPNGIAEAETNMADYARRYGLLSVMANFASSTGGYPMAGRSAVWDEAGSIVAQAEGLGECLVLAEATSAGWQGQVVTV